MPGGSRLIDEMGQPLTYKPRVKYANQVVESTPTVKPQMTRTEYDRYAKQQVNQKVVQKNSIEAIRKSKHRWD